VDFFTVAGGRLATRKHLKDKYALAKALSGDA
jgi:hypothetical protein